MLDRFRAATAVASAVFPLTFAAALLTGLPGLAAAADEAPAIDSGNTAWMLISTALVLFMMIPGLSLFYAGLVRARNVLSILMQCYALTCIMSLVWFASAGAAASSATWTWPSWPASAPIPPRGPTRRPFPCWRTSPTR
jgi:Amt family ammonium transporter